MARATVTLPQGCGDTYEVFINGVPQQPGTDFVQEGRELVFERELKEEGKLGWVRWTSMFLGIAGSYGKNDAVDIAFEVNGRKVVAAKLPIVPAGQ